jgi:hypothetical protein
MKLDASLGVEGKNLRSAADALGFAGLWTSETRHDAFLPLAIAAGAKKGGRNLEEVELATSTFVVEATPAEVGPALKERYAGLIDRRSALRSFRIRSAGRLLARDDRVCSRNEIVFATVSGRP